MDRLLAIYQALWPNNRMQDFVEDDGELTTDTNDLLTESTKLYPFWDNTGDLHSFWMSKEVWDTKPLGYATRRRQTQLGESIKDPRTI